MMNFSKKSATVTNMFLSVNCDAQACDIYLKLLPVISELTCI